jgi:hypothetical protein
MFDKTEYTTIYINNLIILHDHFAMVMESLEKIAKEQKRKKLQQKTIFNYEIKEP